LELFLINLFLFIENNGINLTYIDKCGMIFCVFGAVLFLISFIGCCGALNKIKFLLGIYSVILLLVLMLQIGLSISVVVYSVKLKQILTPFLRESIKKQYMGVYFLLISLFIQHF